MYSIELKNYRLPMKNIKSSMFAVLMITLVAILGATPTQAVSDKVCVCHNVNNNPVELCADDDSFKEGHQNHIDSGFDILDVCPAVAVPSATPTPSTFVPSPTPTGTVVEPTGEVTPEVPEFGLLTGMVTLAMSTGSYFMLKRKV